MDFLWLAMLNLALSVEGQTIAPQAVQAAASNSHHALRRPLKLIREETGEAIVTTGNGNGLESEGKNDHGSIAAAQPVSAAAQQASGSPPADSAMSANAPGPASLSKEASSSADNRPNVSPLEQKGPVENIDNISPSATSEEQQPPVSGVIRYEERQQSDSLKPTLTIFDALDEALVRSPRGAAIRALLPEATAAYARATQQTPAGFNYDNGVWAEFTRRMGVTTQFEGPWNVVFRLITAKYTVQQQKVDCLSQLWQLRSQVRSAYTEVVVAQESLETQNDLWDLSRRLRLVSEKRFQAGDVPELDLLKARTAEAQADIDRAVAFRRVVRAKQQLNVILGRPSEHVLVVPRLPSFLALKSTRRAALQARNPLMPEFAKPVPQLDYYMDLGLQNRYEIKSLDRQIAVAKSQFRYTLGTVFPNLPFWYGASRSGNVPVGPKLNAFYVGFNIPSQLSDFNQGDLSLYKATIRQLEYQLASQRNQVQSDVSSAYNNLLSARQKMRIYEQHVLADSEEVARLARRSYEVGQSDITSTIQAMQNNVQIRLSYLDAITNYTGALTDLERSCGLPLLSADEWD